MKRLLMKQCRKVLLLRWEKDIRVPTILKMIPKLGRSTAYDYLQRAAVAGLTVTKIKSMSDFDLDQVLFPPNPDDDDKRPQPDYAYIHRELLKKSTGVTIDTLWREYKRTYPEGYEKSQFYAKYRAWKQLAKRTLRMDHKPGECLYLDWAGPLVWFKILRPGK